MYNLLDDSPDSGTWSIESQLIPIEPSTTQNHSQQGRLKFTSEKTEFWPDGQQELAYGTLEKNVKHQSKSVPLSPAFATPLKDVGRPDPPRDDHNTSEAVLCTKKCSSMDFTELGEHPRAGRSVACGKSQSYTPPSRLDNFDSDTHTEMNYDSVDSMRYNTSSESTNSRCSCSSLYHSQKLQPNSIEVSKCLAKPRARSAQSESSSSCEREHQCNEGLATGRLETMNGHSLSLQENAETRYQTRLSVDEISRKDGCCSIEWPTAVPIRSATAMRQLIFSNMETMDVFKYCINYPKLFTWARLCMQSYIDWVNKSTTIRHPDVSNIVDEFILRTLRKRERKARVDEYDQGATIFNTISEPSEADFKSQMHQLWKRRYYSLLNAVDFLYKDYQILHYVSRSGLFDYVSAPPSIPAVFFASRSCFSRNANMIGPQQLDSHSLAAVGTDPGGHLSDRVAYLLLSMGMHSATVEKRRSSWPCRFSISVNFLSDVIAQSCILRNELDRRLTVHDRLIYVLGQARQQKAKLKRHILKQREMSTVLSLKLATAGQMLSTVSPTLDQPSTIVDGLANNIDSPFIDCENPENEMEETPNFADTCFPTGTTIVGLNQLNDEWSISEYRRKRLDIQTQIAGLERVLKEEESRRRRLHNYIQDLTGNIRVFCRLRPSEDEKDDTHAAGGGGNRHLRVSSSDKLLFCPEALKDQLGCFNRGRLGLMSIRDSILGPSSSHNCPSWTPRCFIFDRVFDAQATQLEVYKEVDDLIVSCVDGYNVCIMAYGQTGSGKTYTMMGSPDNPGVNRQAVRSLFEHCRKRKQWKYSLFISMVEIYQEDVFDLLDEFILKPGTSTAVGISVSQANPNKKETKRVSMSQCRAFDGTWKHSIPWNTWTSRANASGPGLNSGRLLKRRGSVKILSTELDGVVLKNLKERPVHTEEDVLSHFEMAERQRRVGSTKLNICSSRSHLVIMLKVIGENQITMATSKGSMTLADLAGSENVTKSGSTGERFNEAACINKSLSSLGRVFDALRRQQKPTYRETKLTYLLRPNLGGESKCLLFITLRTEPEHAEETWRAVHFGQGALQVVPGSIETKNPRDSRVSNDKKETPNVQIRPASTTLQATSCSVPIRSGFRDKQKSPFVCGPGHHPRTVCSVGPTVTKLGWR